MAIQVFKRLEDFAYERVERNAKEMDGYIGRLRDYVAHEFVNQHNLKKHWASDYDLSRVCWHITKLSDCLEENRLPSQRSMQVLSQLLMVLSAKICREFQPSEAAFNRTDPLDLIFFSPKDFGERRLAKELEVKVSDTGGKAPASQGPLSAMLLDFDMTGELAGPISASDAPPPGFIFAESGEKAEGAAQEKEKEVKEKEAKAEAAGPLPDILATYMPRSDQVLSSVAAVADEIATKVVKAIRKGQFPEAKKLIVSNEGFIHSAQMKTLKQEFIEAQLDAGVRADAEFMRQIYS